MWCFSFLVDNTFGESQKEIPIHHISNRSIREYYNYHLKLTLNSIDSYN